MIFHSLPLDLTFGAQPTMLPWMSFLWLVTVFCAGRVAFKVSVDAVLDCKEPPSRATLTWLNSFWYAQLFLSSIAGLCFVLTFTQLPLKQVHPAMVPPYVISIGLASCLLIITTAKSDSDVSRVSDRRSRGHEDNRVPPPSRVRGLLQHCSLHASPQCWRVLSLVAFATCMYILNTELLLIVRCVPYVVILGTAAVFLLCTTAVCRDPLSEQSAEFALAAAGVVVAGTPVKIWAAAPAVGNVIVAAAALHMLLSLTNRLPRPALQPKKVELSQV